jgi:hypothetical protein
LEKAKLEMFRSALSAKGRMLLARYGEARSDAKGRWRIREVPSLTDHYLFRVGLNGFTSGEFEIGGEDDSGPLTRTALLANRAEFRLVPGTKVVRNPENHPN